MNFLKYQAKVDQFQKEDIADWLEALLDPDKFDPVELLTTLQTGIVACRVAQKLCQLVADHIQQPKLRGFLFQT